MSAPRPIGYWVKAVDQLIDAQFTAAAVEAGITRRQWQILNLLSGTSATRDEVAAAIAPFLSPGETLDAHLAGIADLLLVDGDRLELTAGGAERLARVKERSVQHLRNRVAVGLTREAYGTTLRTLEQIARNLGWSEPPVGPAWHDAAHD